MDGQQCQNKQHGDTVPEKAHDVFLCSLQINIKKACQMLFSTTGYVCSTQTRVIYNPAEVVLTWHDFTSHSKGLPTPISACVFQPGSIFLTCNILVANVKNQFMALKQAANLNGYQSPTVG